MAKLLLEFSKPLDEVRDAGLPVEGKVSLVISKAKGMRCSKITVQLQCREMSHARGFSSRAGQIGRMGGATLYRGMSSSFKLSNFCVSQELYQSEAMDVLTGTVVHEFSVQPADGSPGSFPLPGRFCGLTTGCEQVQYVLVASALLKGRVRKYKVSCEQVLLLRQRPPLPAIREYRQYYCTEQSTGPTLSNSKTFWFFSGQIQCNASLNRESFFLSENDPLVLSLEVCNNSTARMTGMTVNLAMEVFTDSSEARGAEQEPSRLASSVSHPVEFAIPVEDAMASACVLPSETKGFTWPLPLSDIEQLYPSFHGELVNVQYRLIVKLLFKGFNVPLKVILPVVMYETPSFLELAREKTAVPPGSDEEPQRGDGGDERAPPQAEQEFAGGVQQHDVGGEILQEEAVRGSAFAVRGGGDGVGEGGSDGDGDGDGDAAPICDDEREGTSEAADDRDEVEVGAGAEADSSSDGSES